jgi:hypothetical protein
MREPSGELPSYVAELLEAERHAPRPSAETERRVRGRVAATLALTAAGATSLAASSAVASTAAGVSAKIGGLALGIKVSAVVVGVGVLGTAGGIAWRHQVVAKARPDNVVHAVASHARAAPAKVSVRPLPDVVEPAVATETPAPPGPVREPESAPVANGAPKLLGRSPRTTEAAARDEGNDRGTLADESPLLDRARASIETHYPAQALALLGEHKRRFPHGQLEEEREALWVQALVASGKAEDARARAAEFRRRFPRSIQLPIVEAAVLSNE